MGPYGITANVRTLPSGLQAPILVTKVGWDEPMLEDLIALSRKEGFQMVNILPEDQRTGVTTYHNKYDAQNRRTQHRYTTAPGFDEHDLYSVSQLVSPDGAHFVLGTVTGWGEMSPGFLDGIQSMKGRGIIGAAAQGWHRHIDENNVVHQKRVPRELMDQMFGGIDVCVMSDEDIAFGAKDVEGNPIPDPEYMNEIAQRTGIFILTQGPNGARVYLNGKEDSVVEAFPLDEMELEKRNPTGLGDTFCAISLREFTRGRDIKSSLALAHLITAAKLAEGPGAIQGRGEGMNSLLTTAQLQDFLTFTGSEEAPYNRLHRVQSYDQFILAEHGVDLSKMLREDYSIDIEGVRPSIEEQPNYHMRK